MESKGVNEKEFNPTKTIPLKDFDPNKHVKERYITKRGIDIQRPSGKKDIEVETKNWKEYKTFHSCSVEEASKFARENPEGELNFMILNGSREGQSDWYKVDSIMVEVGRKNKRGK